MINLHGRRKVVSALMILGLVLVPSHAGLQTSASVAGAPSGQTSTLLPDGHILVIGGSGPQGAIDTVVAIDPATGERIAFPSLDRPRAWHTTTVLPDGAVLVLGGVGGDGNVLAAPEIIDPGTGTLTPLGVPGLTPRAGHTATLMTDGRVLIAGGMDDAGQPRSEEHT